ncbi:MAG TPA: aldo/keto reductase, partial [Trueperaceae bacterium]|nr:aldo/keto reductase [Trueperaceae bacterium]
MGIVSDRVPLGRTGLHVSRLGLGCSALGGVFGAVTEADAIDTVHAALEIGINLFDVAPAYAATRSERLLGRALSGVDRDTYVLSTKAGKTTDDAGVDHFDYSEAAIRRSVGESLERLGTDRLDIVHLHDFDYQAGRHVTQALHEGFPTLHALKAEGVIGAVGAGIYFMEMWERVLVEVELDAMVLHNHHTLCDVRAFELLPLTAAQHIGVINAAPFASGLLTGHPAPVWHPASAEARTTFTHAAAVALRHGTDLPRLALGFSCQEPRLPVTIFSCADRATLTRNVRWAQEPVDREHVARARAILEPVMNRQWAYGGTEPGSLVG